MNQIRESWIWSDFMWRFAAYVPRSWCFERSWSGFFSSMCGWLVWNTSWRHKRILGESLIYISWTKSKNREKWPNFMWRVAALVPKNCRFKRSLGAFLSAICGLSTWKSSWRHRRFLGVSLVYISWTKSENRKKWPKYMRGIAAKVHHKNLFPVLNTTHKLNQCLFVSLHKYYKDAPKDPHASSETWHANRTKNSLLETKQQENFQSPS